MIFKNYYGRMTPDIKAYIYKLLFNLNATKISDDTFMMYVNYAPYKVLIFTKTFKKIINHP